VSDAKKTTSNSRKKAVGAEIEARLAAFDEHKEKLLDPLRNVHESGPKTKSFDTRGPWQHLRILAHLYFRSEAEVSQEQAMMPAGDRVKLLRQLGNALRDARCTADEAMKTVRGHWFVEWAEANGNPDFLDPSSTALAMSSIKGSRVWLSWKRPPSGLLRRFVRKRDDRLEVQFYHTTSSSTWKERTEILRSEMRGPAPDHFFDL
jgi:hypothetical protein